jgi:hypothetical protein
MEFYKPTLDEVLDGRELTSAEERLLDCCKTGATAHFADKVPVEPSDANQIDAALIRYLLLGGCDAHRPHPIGVRMIGAYISGGLSFEECITSLALICQNCQFRSELNFRDAKIGSLGLMGSNILSFDGHRMRVERSILLNKGFKAQERTDLSYSIIDGVLACDGGSFFSKEHEALKCSSIEVGGSVFLNDGFNSKGSVKLLDAKIRGQLDCTNGVFDGAGGRALDCNSIRVGGGMHLSDGFTAIGEVDLVGAKITGQLDCEKGFFKSPGEMALNCNSINVGGGVLLNDGCKVLGDVSLSAAKISGNLECSGAEIEGGFMAIGMSVVERFDWSRIKGKQVFLGLTDATVGVLEDDVNSWKSTKYLFLKNFIYNRIGNQFEDFSFAERMEWIRCSRCDDLARSELDKATGFVGATIERFEPQPYVQLAKVLESDGHRSGAARVRERMEWRLRRSEYRRVTFAANGDVIAGIRASFACLLRGFDLAFGVVFGYGHRPLRGLIYALVVICCTSLFYGWVYDRGQFAPNSDVILVSDKWHRFADDPNIVNPAAAWSADKAGTDYESFSAIGYGLDLFLPLDALGQEAAWAPSKDRGTLGKVGFYMRWVVQFLGWVFTGVLAAALTGIIGRKE